MRRLLLVSLVILGVGLVGGVKIRGLPSVGPKQTKAVWIGSNYHADNYLTNTDLRVLRCETNGAGVTGMAEVIDPHNYWTFDSGNHAMCRACYSGPDQSVIVSLRQIGYIVEDAAPVADPEWRWNFYKATAPATALSVTGGCTLNYDEAATFDAACTGVDNPYDTCTGAGTGTATDGITASGCGATPWTAFVADDWAYWKDDGSGTCEDSVSGNRGVKCNNRSMKVDGPDAVDPTVLFLDSLEDVRSNDDAVTGTMYEVPGGQAGADMVLSNVMRNADQANQFEGTCHYYSTGDEFYCENRLTLWGNVTSGDCIYWAAAWEDSYGVAAMTTHRHTRALFEIEELGSGTSFSPD